MRRISRRLTAFLTLVCLLSTSLPFTVLADPTGVNSGSNTSPMFPGTAGRDGGANDPGIMLTLGLIDNTTTDSEKAELSEYNKQAEASGSNTWFTQLSYAFDKDYLNDYPNIFRQQGTSKQSVLIVRSDGDRAITNNELYAYDGNNQAAPFGGVYTVGRSGSPASISSWQDSIIVVSKDISDDISLMNKFRHQDAVGVPTSDPRQDARELLAYCQNRIQWIEDNVGMDGIVTNFLKIFPNTANISTYLNSLQYADGDDSDTAYLKRLKYLDILLIVNYMSGSQHWDVIENFLRTLNQDGSDQFSVIWMESVVSYSGYWFSYPSYFAYCTKKDIEYFIDEMCNFKSAKGLPNYSVGNSDTWLRAIEQAAGGMGWSQSAQPTWVSASQRQMYGNGKFCWSNMRSGSAPGWEAATVLMPVDKHGNQSGTFSYTCFSLAGNRGLNVPDISGGLYLDASTVFNAITINDDLSTSPESISADIYVSLQETDPATLNNYIDTFRQNYELTGKNPTLEMTFYSDRNAGTCTNTIAFDGSVGTVAGAGILKLNENKAGCTNGSVNNAASYKWQDIPIGEFQKFLSGEYFFQF